MLLLGGGVCAHRAATILVVVACALTDYFPPGVRHDSNAVDHFAHHGTFSLQHGLAGGKCCMKGVTREGVTRARQHKHRIRIED